MMQVFDRILYRIFFRIYIFSLRRVYLLLDIPVFVRYMALDLPVHVYSELSYTIKVSTKALAGATEKGKQKQKLNRPLHIPLLAVTHVELVHH